MSIDLTESIQRYSTSIVIPVSIGVILITAPLLACVPSLRFRVHIAFIPLRQCLSSIPTARFPRSLRIFCKYIPKSFFNLFSKPPSVYTTYPDPVSEEAYWTSACSGQRELASSNTNTRLGTAIPGLIVYYSPALLPTYRERGKASKKGVEERRVYISPRTFLEWHRMVFPDSVCVNSLCLNVLHADKILNCQGSSDARPSLQPTLEFQRSRPKGDAADCKAGPSGGVSQCRRSAPADSAV
jgi:hypothetical protein